MRKSKKEVNKKRESSQAKNSVLRALSIAAFAGMTMISSSSVSYADDNYSSLYEAIKAETATSYTLSADETATQNYGDMNASNLTITGNNHAVNGSYTDGSSTNHYEGITVANGQKLNINNVGAFTSAATAEGATIGVSTNEQGQTVITTPDKTVTITNNGFNGFYTNAGGALSNNGTLGIANSVFSNNSSRDGGAIYNGNSGTIDSIKNSTFTNNSATGQYAYGGAISNYASNGSSATIGDITGYFIGNYASNGSGGAISNYTSRGSATIEDIMGDFIGNYVSNGSGGAISNYAANSGSATIGDITGDFIGNYASNGSGGAIYNYTIGGSATIEDITGDFIGNYASNGSGGAIYNTGTNTKIQSIKDSTFSGNSAKTSGGAIYNTGTIGIIADQKDVLFNDNYTGTVTRDENGNITDLTGATANDIYNSGTINLQAKAGRTITFNGTITDAGTPKGTLNIGVSSAPNGEVPPSGGVGVSTLGTVIFNNTVTQKTVNLNNGATVKLGTNAEQGTHGTLNMSAFSNDANGGTIDMQDGATNNSVDFGSTVTLNNDLKINTDLDLANKVMDTIKSTDDATVADNGYHIILNEIKVVADPTEKLPLSVNFAQGKVKDYVTLTGTSVSIAGVTNPNNSYITTYTTADGNLKFEYGNLYTAVHTAGDERVYTMKADEPALPDGIMGYGNMESTSLTVNGNGFSVSGNNKSGITIGSGKTLTINNIGSIDTTTISNGFNGFVSSDNGGVINNSGTLTVNNVVFSNNKATYYGGAISNASKIGTVIADFTGNSANSGGAISNTGTITTIGTADSKATFENNQATNGSGGAIYNGGSDSKIETIIADFTGNSANSGGAIFNTGTITTIGTADSKATFENNKATYYGGAIYNAGFSKIETIIADFTGNSANSGGAIFNYGTITTIGTADSKATFKNNQATNGFGGAIYNGGSDSKIETIIADFTGNSAGTSGGAIYNTGTIGITADQKDVLFKDNYTGTVTRDENGNITDHSQAVANDIYNEGTVNLQAKEGRTITFNGTITDNATPKGTMNIGGAVSAPNGEVPPSGGEGVSTLGTVIFNNTVTQNTVNLNNGATVKLGANTEQGSHGTLNMSVFSNDANGGTIDMRDGVTGNSVDFGSTVTLNNDLKINADLDLANKVMDTIMSTDDATVADNGHNIILNEITVLADPTEKLPFTVNFAQGKVKDYVTLTGTSVSIAGVTNPNNSYITTYSTENGNLNFEYGNLYTAVNTQGDGRVYTMTEDEAELPDTISSYGTMASKDLSISGNNHSIKGGGKEGIAVDNGKTLSANDVTFDGFSTALTTTEGGKLILRNTTFSNNNNDVINNGTTDLQGDVTLNNITGDNGTLNVTAGLNTVANTLTQKDVTVSSGASLVNNGTATISNLTNNNEIRGTGTLTVTGNTTNNGYIFQDKITNTGIFTTNIEKIVIQNELENNGTLNLTGKVIFGTTIPEISGTGTTNINSDIKNRIDITQGNLRVANDKTFTNDGSVTSSLTNNGTFLNREGKTATINLLNNSNRIENNGTMSVAGGTNTGILHGTGTLEIKAGENINNTGEIAQQEITNNGSVSTDSTKFFAESGTITNNGTLTYNAGQNTVNDITGDSTGNVVLNTNGDFHINNKISGTQWSLNSGTLYFGDNADVASAAAFNANGGTINVMNGKIGDRDLGNVNLNGKTNLAMDFNLKNLSSDTFIAKITNNGGKFNVNKINVMGSTLQDHIKVHLGDSSNLGRDNVTSDTFDLPTIMTPIRKIAGRVEDGYLMYAPTGNSSNDYNPAVLAGPVAAQFGGYLSQLNSYDEAFRNLDMKMLLNRQERQALRMRNSYASEVTPHVYSPTYLPEKDSAGWFRPYATFEKVDLRGGPKVSNVMYGSYFGGDSQMYTTKNGWDYQYSVYVGYNGSHQAYSGNDIYQNGGNLGATGIWYKGDFFTALTANVGASVAEASTMYGHEDFPMLMSGVASKSGYNFELAHGKFIIQPSYMMSYTFVNTFDYTNGAGVRIKSDPLHAINITPGLKFIGNLKNGWQPYASVQMVWNIMDKTDFTAANIDLPDMSVKPYVQYGVGLQKRWGKRFTGFGQAMIRNGGRNGIALSAGFRWALGKDPEKAAEKINRHSEALAEESHILAKTNKNKKISKQQNGGFWKNLSSAFGNIFNHPNNKTVKTPAVAQRKVIKQLTPEQKVRLNNKNYNPLISKK